MTKSTRNRTIKTPFIKSLIYSLFAPKHQIPTELHLEEKKLKIKKTLRLKARNKNYKIISRIKVHHIADFISLTD